MADQPARQDPNQFPALVGHTGTAGTAETVRGVFGADGGFYLTGLHGVVLTTAIAVANGTATVLPGTLLANRKSFICFNAGTTKCWLGGTGVTASDTGGIPVGTQEYSPSIDMGTAIIYGIAAAAGGTITVFEIS